MPYAGANAWAALGQGLQDISRGIGQRQRDAEEQARYDEQNRRRMAALRSRDLSQPGGMTLEQAVARGLVSNPNDLANAGTPEVDVRFAYPETGDVQDRTPYMTEPGVVMSPRLAREEGEAATRRDQLLATQAAEAARFKETDRNRGLIGALQGEGGEPRYSTAETNALAAGMSLPRQAQPRNIDPNSPAGIDAYRQKQEIDARTGTGRTAPINSLNDAREEVRKQFFLSNPDRYGPAYLKPPGYTDEWFTQATLAVQAGRTPPPIGRATFEYRTVPGGTATPNVGPPSSLRPAGAAISDGPPPTGMRMERRTEMSRPDTVGMGAAAARAQQLRAEGKTLEEIIAILRSEGIDVVR